MKSSRRIERPNLILLAAVVVLCALSAFTYWQSVTRAERFERGQAFLPNLNPDEIAQIEIRRGENRVHLERNADGDRFRVKNAHGYRADNAVVNRFLRDLLDLGLEKEVGRATDALAEDLGVAYLDDGALPEGTLEVALVDDAGDDMVRFLVGESPEDGSGRYVRRVTPDAEASTIYIADAGLTVDTETDEWVDQEILDVPQDEIHAIRGDGFEIARLPKESPAETDSQTETETTSDAETETGAASEPEYGPLELQEPAGEESGKVGSVKRVLSPLRFTKHHLADAPEVQGLVFDRTLEVELTDGSAYRLELATRGEEHYLRVGAFHTQAEVYLDREASEDEVRETSEILLRADEIQAFRDYHGSWIYEVSDTTAERVGVEASELVE